MDIERLKDARYTAGYTTVSKLTEMDWTELREISKDLIDEAIARQSVKSEEIQEAIDMLQVIRPSEKEIKSGEYPEVAESLALAITALQAYQPWVSVGDRLPEIPEGRYGVMCNVMVDNCSSTKVMSLLYERDTVRGKTVCRWKWYGKISPWNVTHWKPLPEPPKGE